MNRRQFLGTTAAALVSAPLSASAPAQNAAQDKPVAPKKSLPIGVFDPPFNKLSLDEMLDRFASLGIEAVEVGAAGPNGSPHCPRPELVADPAKARAWKKKFDDRGIPVMTLSCHNNALYPDAAKAHAAAEQFRQTLQLAGMLEIPTVVGFSGCPGGSPTDTVPNWVVYRWPDEHGEALDWQWKERVIPYWQETAKFAREHGVHRIALEMHPNFVVYNPRTLLRLREAAGEEIGANCDLSHLFWQQCNAVEVIRFLGKQGAIYHAHMKDTAFFPHNVDRFGVLNFGKKDDHEASEFFRAVGYGHGASAWKDIVAAYMEIGYTGMLSIENEDPILSGEVGVQRSLAVLKNVREELLTNQPTPVSRVVLTQISMLRCQRAVPVVCITAALEVTGGCPTFAPAYSGFPVELAGAGALHAAFFIESRTRGCWWSLVQEIRIRGTKTMGAAQRSLLLNRQADSY